MSADRSCGTARSRSWDSARDQERTDAARETAGRVLVVDDDPIIRRFLKRVLSRDWQVDMAANAREGAGMMFAVSYHAVITDFDMPGETGLWLLNFSRRYFPETIRILSSGSDELECDTSSLGDLVDYSLPKPLNPARLSEILRDSLA